MTPEEKLEKIRAKNPGWNEEQVREKFIHDQQQGERLRKTRAEKRQKEWEHYRSKFPSLTDAELKKKINRIRRANRRAKEATAEAEDALKEIEAAKAKQEEKSVAGGEAEYALAVGREELKHHPLFGKTVLQGATGVKLYREPSGDPMHSYPGVSSGFLEDIDFEIFNEALVKARHGGGKYRAVAIDGAGRSLTHATMTIAGKAKKPFEPDDDDDDDDDDGHPSIFQQQAASQEWMMRSMMEQQERQRAEELRRRSLEETKWERIRREDREQREQRERERAVAEERRWREEQAARERENRRLSEQRERERAEARERQEMFWKMQAQQQQTQMQLFQAMMQAQQSNTQTLVAVLGKDGGGGGSAVKAMATVMESISGIYGSLVDTVQASIGGEDNRSIAERMVTTLATAGAPLIERIAESIVPPNQQPQPPTTNASRIVPPPDPNEQVQLPDGRVTTMGFVFNIARDLEQRIGRPPSEKEIIDHVSKALSPVLPPPQTQPQEEKPPVPPQVSKTFVVEVLDAFKAGHKPLDFLESALKLGKITPEGKKSIGSIYENADEQESLRDILTKVFAYLGEQKIETPPGFLFSFLASFSSEKGSEWLDTMLLGCAAETIDAARAEIASAAGEEAQAPAA